MPEFKKIIVQERRRMHFKGALKGKYIGFPAEVMEQSDKEQVYDIQVYEANIQINETDFILETTPGKLPFPEFDGVEKFNTKLPSSAYITLTGKENQPPRHFKANVKNLRASNILLSKRLQEEDKIFGTMTGSVSGYLEYFEPVEHLIKVPDPPIEVKTNTPTNKEPSLPPDEKTSVKNPEVQVIQDPNSPPDKPPVLEPLKPDSFWESILSVIAFLLGILYYGLAVLFVVALLVQNWQIFAGLAVLVLFNFLSSKIGSIGITLSRTLLNVLGFAFYSMLFLLFFKYVTEGSQPVSTPTTIKDQPEEVRQTVTVVAPQDTFARPDTTVRNYRIWHDYDGKTYSGYLAVRKSDWDASTGNRSAFNLNIQSEADFRYLFSKLGTFDSTSLFAVYAMFDSIQNANQLSRIKFAELIVSCVQDIPYTLILDGPCNGSAYDIAFISEYLKRGGPCLPFIRFGLLTPVEFTATLDGDCDTRSLFLFLVLSHYGYDVALLTSSYYSHAIIAVNLPVLGQNIVIDRKRYLLWETTIANMRPGVFPNEYSDLKHWEICLLHSVKTE